MKKIKIYIDLNNIFFKFFGGTIVPLPYRSASIAEFADLIAEFVVCFAVNSVGWVTNSVVWEYKQMVIYFVLDGLYYFYVYIRNIDIDTKLLH